MEKTKKPMNIYCNICNKVVDTPYMCQHCQRSVHKECLAKVVNKTSKCSLCNHVMTLDEILKNRILNEVIITAEPIKEETPTSKPSQENLPFPMKKEASSINRIANQLSPVIPQPRPIEPPPKCANNHNQVIEFYFECENLLGCKLCVSKHNKCEKNKPIPLKDLKSPTNQLREMISNINSELDTLQTTLNQHQNQYSSFLFPFICDIDANLNKAIKNAESKAEETIESIEAKYKDLVQKTQKVKKELDEINVFESDWEAEEKASWIKMRKIEEEKPLNFRVVLERDFSMKFIQPPFQREELLIKMPSVNQHSEMTVRMYYIDWAFKIKTDAKSYFIEISTASMPEEAKFILNLRLYNYNYFEVKKKGIAYSSFNGQNFRISLIDSRKEYADKLFLFEVEIRPENYVDIINLLDIAIKPHLETVPTKASKGGAIQDQKSQIAA